MTLLFFSLSITASLMFFFLSNPLSLGLILIVQTLTLSIFMGSMMNHFWFLYLLILVFIGGMLVLFIYATSIFPNEKFIFNQYLLTYIIFITATILLMMFFLNYFFNNNLLLNDSQNLNMIINHQMIKTMKIFSSQTSTLFLFMVSYLFYCMVIVIKITNFFSGPLRKLI